MAEKPFFQVGGTLGDDARSYVERPADGELMAALERGELCLVLAPRQTGKSSLMVHAAAELRAKVDTTAGIVDLQPLGSQHQAEQWFADVAYQIERSLELETDSYDWWEAHAQQGATQRFMTFLEDVVLAETEGSVVLFFDEVDSVLELPFSDDFFTTLRALYNARSTNAALRRLSFVLLGVATPSSFVKERTRTPFNVGTSIELGDFEKDSTDAFCEVLGDGCAGLVERIFYWTRGQPLLVQALAAKAHAWAPEERTPERFDREVRSSYLEKRIEQDTHLKFIRDYLLDSHDARAVLGTYERVVRGMEVDEDDKSPVQARLKLGGVVRAEDKKLRPRNRIYSAVFDREWIRENRPRDLGRRMGYVAAAALFLGLLWTQALQPGLFPRFPDVSPVEIYTGDPSTSFSVPLAGTDVRRVYLGDGRGGERQLLIPDNRLIQETLGGLPEGPSTGIEPSFVVSPSLTTAKSWPPRASTKPSSCGTWRAARKSAPSWGMRLPSETSRSLPTARSWLPRAMTTPSGCGTWTWREGQHPCRACG